MLIIIRNKFLVERARVRFFPSPLIYSFYLYDRGTMNSIFPERVYNLHSWYLFKANAAHGVHPKTDSIADVISMNFRVRPRGGGGNGIFITPRGRQINMIT